MTLHRRSVLGLGVPAVLIMTGCAAPAEPSGPLPADQLVFSATTHPGLVPPIHVALIAPSLAVYGDGRVIMIEPERTLGKVPPRYLLATVDPLAVARFAVRAEKSGLISEQTRFGFPQVTDLGMTTVTLHGERSEVSVNLYAFVEQFDDDLGWRERRNRRELRRMISAARSLAAEAATTPYLPDRIAVLELTDYSGAPAAQAPWPGPHPSTFLHRTTGRGPAVLCGELTGEPARTVYLAARDNPDQRWLVDGRTRVLAIGALPIGPVC